jgi:hypothetical protein
MPQHRVSRGILLSNRAGVESLLPVRGAPGAVDRVVSFVDVHDGAVAQAAGFRDIFGVVEIVMRAAEQLICASETIVPAEMRIDRRMVLGILAIVDGGVLDFSDGRVDFSDGVVVFTLHGRPLPALAQVGAGHAQIAQRVKIGGVGARHLLRGGGRREQSDGGEK